MADPDQGPFRCLIIDSIIALFRAEFSGRGELSERQQKLGAHLAQLVKMAEEFNVAVVVVNQCMADPGALAMVSLEPCADFLSSLHVSCVHLSLQPLPSVHHPSVNRPTPPVRPCHQASGRACARACLHHARHAQEGQGRAAYRQGTATPLVLILFNPLREKPVTNVTPFPRTFSPGCAPPLADIRLPLDARG